MKLASHQQRRLLHTQQPLSSHPMPIMPTRDNPFQTLRTYRTQQQDEAQNNREFSYTNLMSILSVTGLALFFAKLVSDSYIPKTLKGEAILTEDQERPHIKRLDGFQLAKSDKSAHESGRSGCKKYYRVNEDGKKEFYYVKRTFSRQNFIKELMYGSFAQVVSNNTWPPIVVMQGQVGLDGQVEYYLGSKSLSKPGAVPINLENYCDYILSDAELDTALSRPVGLGCTLFIKALLGDSDVKLANLITVLDDNIPCYGCDNEFANHNYSTVIIEAEKLLECIAEFVNPLTSTTGLLQQENDSSSFDPDKKFIGDAKALARLRPILLEAIENDCHSGDIFNILVEVTALSDQAIEEVVNRYGDFLTPTEKDQYYNQFCSIRENARQELEKLEQQDYGNSSMRP